MDTFSLSNGILKKYLIKLLNYNNIGSDSYNKVRNKLKGNDDFVLSLIGGNDEYHKLKGVEKSNYINELLADLRYRGENTLRHVSFAARNLNYLSKINMDKRELFTELRKMCAESSNPASRRAFNELVKSFDCPCGASLSNSGISDGGVDLTGKMLSQEEIDEQKRIASRSSFSEEITSFDEFKSWLHNFMKNAHGENYNEQLTEKVADNLDNKYNGDYGAMIGAAKSFLY